VTEPYEGTPPAPVEDRDWWSDHLWLYDRVVHGVPITERTAAEFLEGASSESLATAIGNYSRALGTRMMQRARMHLRAGMVEAACQYECEALLAAVEAVAADRGLTFWSDRTILEKAKRVQRPDDGWDAGHLERLFADLVRRAWGAGADRSDEVPGVLRALLGAEPDGSANDPETAHQGAFRSEDDPMTVPGWLERVCLDWTDFETASRVSSDIVRELAADRALLRRLVLGVQRDQRLAAPLEHPQDGDAGGGRILGLLPRPGDEAVRAAAGAGREDVPVEVRPGQRGAPGGGRPEDYRPGVRPLHRDARGGGDHPGRYTTDQGVASAPRLRSYGWPSSQAPDTGARRARFAWYSRPVSHTRKTSKPVSAVRLQENLTKIRT
jgi:hypothetical protein